MIAILTLSVVLVGIAAVGVALVQWPSTTDAAPHRPLYGRTLAAWLAATLVPPAAVFGLLLWAVSARCGPDSVDCSWGFEFLIVIPVYALCALTLGPLAVLLVLRWSGDGRARSTALWALALVVPSAVLAVVSGGLALALPPLAGRLLALRPVTEGRRQPAHRGPADGSRP